MFNMIRMDVYRLFRYKAFYIIIAIAAFTAVIGQTLFYLFSRPDILNSLQQTGALAPSDIEFFNIGKLTVLEYIDQSMFKGGMYSVMLCILSTLFIGADFSSGYIKNILAYRGNKFSYIISKLVTLITAGFILSLVMMLIALVMAMILPIGYLPSSFADIASYYLTLQLLSAGLIGMTLFAMLLTRRESAGIGISIVIGGGILSMLLEQLLHLFGRSMVPFSLILKQAQIPTVFEPMVNINYCLTGLIWCVIYLMLGAFFLYKKDVA